MAPMPCPDTRTHGVHGVACCPGALVPWCMASALAALAALAAGVPWVRGFRATGVGGVRGKEPTATVDPLTKFLFFPNEPQ